MKSREESLGLIELKDSERNGNDDAKLKVNMRMKDETEDCS